MNSSRTPKIILLALLALLAIVAAWWASSKSEPAYAGRELTSWIADLGDEMPETNAQAEEAIRQIGTNALPHLVRLLDTRDSKLKQWIMRWDRRNAWLNLPMGQAEEIQDNAARAMLLLGPAAESAIPDLARLLMDPQTSAAAARALAGIGASAVKPLSDGLAHPDRQVRLSAGLGLGQLGAQAKAAIPQLKSLLQDPDHRVRARAVWAIGQIERDPAALADLIGLSREDPHPAVRSVANSIFLKLEETEDAPESTDDPVDQ